MLGNKVWGIALAWEKPKPDGKSGGCTLKTRFRHEVGGPSLDLVITVA